MKTNKKGNILAVLLVALIMSFMIAGYLSLTVSEAKLSDTSLCFNAALNIAEAAAEDAVYAINRKFFEPSNYQLGPNVLEGTIVNNWQQDGWVQATTDKGTIYRKTSPPINLKNGKIGYYRVSIMNLNSKPNRPSIIAEGNVKNPNGKVISKHLEIKLRPRTYFDMAFAAKKSIGMGGNNFTLDSFDSRTSPGGQYSVAVRNDNGSAGCISLNAGAVGLGNTNIYGYVSTGGGEVNFGPNASIRGDDTPPGIRIDQDRITYDYQADFPDPQAPQLKNPLGFPTIGKNATSVSIGAMGASTDYLINSSVSLTSKITMNIKGNVKMVLNGDLTIKGEIVIEPGSSLELYIKGNMDIGGNGITNKSGLAQNCLIFGINDPKSAPTTINLHGNGNLIAAVYAPNSNATLSGGGNAGFMNGSLVANEITVNGGGGSYGFHYDEALADLNNDGTMRMTSWREILTEEDKLEIETVLGF